MADINLAALIVRNINDLEAAIHHTKTVIDRRLWEAMADLLTAQLDGTEWHIVADHASDDIWFARPQWRGSAEDEEVTDFWLGLDEYQPKNVSEATWLATFLCRGLNGASTGLYYKQDLLGKAAWKQLLKTNEKLLKNLETFGFRRGNYGSLYIPITLELEMLAKAFEEDEFGPALKPLAQAIDNVIVAQAEVVSRRVV